MKQPRITRHARQRLQQRGARTKELAIVMAYADIEMPARNGCRFLQLSHRAVANILAGGHIGIQDLDRAKRLTVLADPSDQVVTVLRGNP